MSYMVARMQKMKAGNLGGAFKHNERVFETHSNKDINPSRSHLNYELTDRDRSVSYEKQIKDYVNENKVSNRAIRKDAVLCDEWIITSDKDFFEKLDEEQTRTFFETAKNYFAENYGESNIAYASVHLDESTPHMHMGVVPFENGKLSSKAMFDREELKHIQEDLPRYMSDHGFELERGKLNSEAKHKTVAEFKRAMADMELKEELLEKYHAPLFVDERTGELNNDTEAFWHEKEFADMFEVQSPIRETTNQEKMDWLRKQYQEELKKLESSKKPLEDDLSHLEELLDKKTKEYIKIDSEASERASELSKAEGYINTLENHSKSLEAKIECLESDNLQLEKQKATKLEAKALNESELRELKPKKNFLGKEHYELSPEQFEGLKAEVYRSRTLLHHKDIELEQAKRQVSLRASKNYFTASLERAKEKAKGESIDRLKSEIKRLKNENSILRQQNDKMLGKLRELMPDKAFKNLLSELKAIKPIVNIIKKAIEKSLF
uniref:MobV family relaxase n=1 Tax=Streptococcus pneumoniae TaxID=1313 RepID=UPI0000170D41|nr:MobV family relaxase [Streptococcus pneumoniae]AAA25387.1 mobilization peptide [Plasmid pMV158]UES86008.1 initiator of conjugative mobilization [Streptococcus pneumoniae]